MQNSTSFSALSFLLVVISAVTVTASPPQRFSVAAFQNEELAAPQDIMPRVLLSSRNLRIKASSDVKLTVLNESGGEEPIASGPGLFPTISGIAQGWYTVIAHSINDVAVFPIFVEVLPDDRRNEVRDEDAELEIRMIPGGLPVATAASRFYLNTGDEGEAAPPDGEILQYDTGSRHDYRVRLTDDGRLLGQVIARSEDGQNLQLAANNNVLLVKDGRRIRSVVSDEAGRFEFSDITSGVYGIVAAGPGGYTAFAFEATNTRLVVDKLRERGFVAAPDVDADVLPVVLVPSSFLARTKEVLEEAECPPDQQQANPQTPNTAQSPGFSNPTSPATSNYTGGFGTGVTPTPGVFPLTAAALAALAGRDDGPIIASPSIP